jgi:hypothetical protein
MTDSFIEDSRKVHALAKQFHLRIPVQIEMYAKGSCSAICQKLLESLPRELRDKVYENIINELNLEVYVDIARDMSLDRKRNTLLTVLQVLNGTHCPKERDFGRNTRCWNDEFTGPDFLEELSQIWFQNCVFNFGSLTHDHQQIPYFLNISLQNFQ